MSFTSAGGAAAAETQGVIGRERKKDNAGRNRNREGVLIFF